MFTGLIEDVATVLELTRREKTARLRVQTSLPTAEIRLGDSVAVNGACLTVESYTGNQLVFHCLGETLARTNLNTVVAGDPVNLERALRLGDRLGGHLVSGHIDATAAILDLGKREADIVLRLAMPAALRALVVPKGSIAVNGISLTIAEVGHADFALHIIPHTWNATNLQTARKGDLVNLEGDMIGKFVLRREQVQRESTGGVGMDDLSEAGFLT